MKRIEILGTGCAKCNELESRTKEAVKTLGIEAEISKVSDIKKISQYGVMITPALAVDGVVKVTGKVPKVEEIQEWIK